MLIRNCKVIFQFSFFSRIVMKNEWKASKSDRDKSYFFPSRRKTFVKDLLPFLMSIFLSVTSAGGALPQRVRLSQLSLASGSSAIHSGSFHDFFDFFTIFFFIFLPFYFFRQLPMSIRSAWPIFFRRRKKKFPTKSKILPMKNTFLLHNINFSPAIGEKKNGWADDMATWK